MLDRKVFMVPVMICGLLRSTCALAQDTVSADGKVVSHDASKDPPYEWTLERMLLAAPMPMSAEGRKFMSTHPSLEGIASWSKTQFDKYLDSDFAKQHAAEEALRWRDLCSMLERQLVRGSQFLKKPQYLPSPAKPSAYNWKEMSLDELRKLIDGNQREIVFEQMKTWRRQIAERAPKLEALRKEAKSKGLSDKFEEALGE